VAFELSEKTWKLDFATGHGQTPGERSMDQRGQDVPFTTQTRLSFDVILPLWGRRGPR
jgi:hypothetical protein